MQTYLVGGAVRDRLLGNTSSDRDWVVVGATPQQLLDRGFIQVGADFPVFLHPETREEHALARSERKSGAGYNGFLVNTENITLEEDLARRDLTINAMAMDESGRIIDPYNGVADLKARVLRHVGPAFEEDPLRVLRVLRFLARFGPDWTIAPATSILMNRMISAGQLAELTRERIWKEISRGLMEWHPHVMCEALRSFRLLEVPGFEPYRGYFRCDDDLRRAVTENATVATRFCLAFGGGGKKPQFGHEIPTAVKDAVGRYQLMMEAWQREGALSARTMLTLVEASGGRRPGGADESALHAVSLMASPLHWQMRRALQAVAGVDIKAIAASMPPGPAVGQAISQARMQALEAAGFAA